MQGAPKKLTCIINTLSDQSVGGKSVHLEQYVNVILRNVDGAAEVAASLHSFILSL